jgi:hypothetical protein
MHYREAETAETKDGVDSLSTLGEFLRRPGVAKE